jgi:hypothetical protein
MPGERASMAPYYDFSTRVFPYQRLIETRAIDQHNRATVVSRQGEHVLINLEQHKGSPCVYSSRFCQEGYCSGCDVYSAQSLNIEIKKNQPRISGEKEKSLKLERTGVR